MRNAPKFQSQEEMIEHTVIQLNREFTGVFSVEAILRVVTESADALGDVRVKTFIPLFVHRFARDRLRAAAQVQDGITKSVPEVLFVCVQNAGRSQMAAALLERAAQGRVHVRSAGSTPADDIHATVREAMAELCVDLSTAFPKPLTDEVVRAADIVITMGCGDACPVYPGKRYLDWDVPDPAGKPLDEVRLIRDEVDMLVHSLLSDLAPAGTRGPSLFLL
jgi:arsenate reductase